MFGADGDLMIFDIWESQEDFEAFARVMGPILAELGVDPGEPRVMPVHRLV